MSKKYVIAWKSYRTGAQGQGSAEFSKAEAAAIVESLNKEDKQYQLLHWAQPVNAADLDTQPIPDDAVGEYVIPDELPNPEEMTTDDLRRLFDLVQVEFDQMARGAIGYMNETGIPVPPMQREIEFEKWLDKAQGFLGEDTIILPPALDEGR